MPSNLIAVLGFVFKFVLTVNTIANYIWMYSIVIISAINCQTRLEIVSMFKYFMYRVSIFQIIRYCCFWEIQNSRLNFLYFLQFGKDKVFFNLQLLWRKFPGVDLQSKFSTVSNSGKARQCVSQFPRLKGIIKLYIVSDLLGIWE
jgi:hypothetical protein